MNPAQLKRACERFYGADTSGKILGTGLGMSIVKEIIDLHHGTLKIDSTPGKGTQVRLCLPAYSTRQGRAGKTSPIKRASDTCPGTLS